MIKLNEHIAKAFKTALAEKQPFINDALIEYFDPQYGYVDYSSLGISQIRIEAVVS